MGSERKFQRQEQVKDNSTGKYHATDHIVRITHWRWYLLGKVRAYTNSEYPTITQPEIDVHTPSQTVFKQEQNELFVQQVFQYSHDLEGGFLYYHVLCLNESSTEDYFKKNYYKMTLLSHPDKNKHPQASADFRMINETNQGLEFVLRHNDSMRRTQ